jgi:hypothetical protein
MHVVDDFLESLEVLHNQLEIGVESSQLKVLLLLESCELRLLSLTSDHPFNFAHVKLISHLGHFLIPYFKLLVQFFLNGISLQITQRVNIIVDLELLGEHCQNIRFVCFYLDYFLKSLRKLDLKILDQAFERINLLLDGRNDFIQLLKFLGEKFDLFLP